MHNRPKIAIIGVGRWGKRLVSEFVKQADLVAVCHQDSADTKTWLTGNYPDLPNWPLAKILSRPEVEALVIATPPATHYEIAKQTLASGKDAWVEKPVGVNAGETATLGQIAEREDRVLFAGYTYLYHPAWTEIKRILAQHREAPRWFGGAWLKWGSFATPIDDNLLCHDLALAQDLFGETITAKELTRHGGISAKDVTTVDLWSDKRVIGSIYLNRLSSVKTKSVFVESATGRQLLWENDQLYEIKNGELTELVLEAKTALAEECRAFLRAIGSRQTPLTGAALGLAVRQTIDKIIRQ